MQLRHNLLQRSDIGSGSQSEAMMPCCTGANSGISKNFEDTVHVLGSFVEVEGVKKPSSAVALPEVQPSQSLPKLEANAVLDKLYARSA